MRAQPFARFVFSTDLDAAFDAAFCAVVTLATVGALALFLQGI